MAKTKNFADRIRAKLASDPDLAALVEDEAFGAEVASEIFTARTDAGLTQKELADRVGTHQSVIARLESADYNGHSLSMLRKIAGSLNKRLRVGFYAVCEYQPNKRSSPLPAPQWGKAKSWPAGVHVQDVQ